MYEDEGEGWGFKNGNYRLTTFTAKVDGDALVIRRTAEGDMEIPARKIKLEIISDRRTLRKTVAESDEMRVSVK